MGNVTLKILQKRGRRWTLKDQKGYDFYVSCDASGLKRYFTVFQDKFNFIEEGDVYEFRFVKVGINGLSLSVGWGSFCEKVENPAIQTIFENFFAYDQVILGQIDGVNEFSKFMGCDNLQENGTNSK